MNFPNLTTFKKLQNRVYDGENFRLQNSGVLDFSFSFILMTVLAERLRPFEFPGKALTFL